MTPLIKAVHWVCGTVQQRRSRSTSPLYQRVSPSSMHQMEATPEEVAKPGCWRGRRAKRSLPVPPEQATPHNLMPNYIPPPQKVARGDAMIPSTNRGSQTTLPRPKHRTLQEKLGKYVARDANMVARLGW